MKTDNLSGAVLDEMVANAMGWYKHIYEDGDFDWREAPTTDDEIGMLVAESNYHPSTDGSLCSQLIENEGIGLLQPSESPCGLWHASYSHPDFLEHTGETHILAVMRCYVSKHLNS